MNIDHDVANKRYKLSPEKFAPFNERVFYYDVIEWSNRIGLKGYEIISTSTEPHPYVCLVFDYIEVTQTTFTE